MRNATYFEFTIHFTIHLTNSIYRGMSKLSEKVHISSNNKMDNLIAVRDLSQFYKDSREIMGLDQFHY